MGTLTLDTSGMVDFGPCPEIALCDPFAFTRYISWSDLDPFTQGYIEALFQGPWKSPNVELRANMPGKDHSIRIDVLGFRHLAPEALALILKDCVAHERAYPLQAHDHRRLNRGFNFWRNRQAGMWSSGGWPPLTAYLGDDGKVYLREAA